MTFESTFKALKTDNFAFYLMQIASFETQVRPTQFMVIPLLLSEEIFWLLYLNFCT